MLRADENPIQRWPENRPLEEDMGHWWVIRTKPRNEKSLAWDLKRVGVGYYLPQITKRTVRSDNGKPRKSIVCLFPGYISIVGYENHKNDILRTGRVLCPIMIEDQERFIYEISRIQKAIEYSSELELHTRLAEGQAVVINEGPLEGVLGVVTEIGDGRNKVYLNVEMFGSSISVSIPASSLMPVKRGDLNTDSSFANL